MAKQSTTTRKQPRSKSGGQQPADSGKGRNGRDVSSYEQELSDYLQQRIKPGLNRGAIPLLARSIAKELAHRAPPEVAGEDEEASASTDDFDDETEAAADEVSDEETEATAEEDSDEETEATAEEDSDEETEAETDDDFDDETEAEADDDFDDEAEADDETEAEADDEAEAEADDDFDDDDEAEVDDDEDEDEDETEAEADDDFDEPDDDQAADGDEPSDFEAGMHDLQAELGEDWILRFSVHGEDTWLTAEKEDGSQHVEAPTASVLAEVVDVLNENGGRSS